MDPEKDAFGNIIQDIYTEENPDATGIIEREDGYVSAEDQQYLFSSYNDWDNALQEAISHSKGKILDIGCGAGRHSLYLQNQGHSVIGLDNSPLAVKVCKDRGINRVKQGPFESLTNLDESFDTILLLGNNFGLVGQNPVEKFNWLHENTTDNTRIITEVQDYSATDETAHITYHKLNQARNRWPGCITMRLRYKHFKTDWMDYLFVDYNEFQDILSQTPWTETQQYVKESGFVSIIE